MISTPPTLSDEIERDNAACYAGLLVRLHELALAGEDESDEADEIRDEMTIYWNRMSGVERERMRWLSADLQTIEEGGVRAKEMSAGEEKKYEAELRKTVETDDPDGQLEFLRQPYPKTIPHDNIPYLQSHAWERLGNLNVALVFLREAERHCPSGDGVMVMNLLRRLGRQEEAEIYATRLLNDPESPPHCIYFAASIFELNQLDSTTQNAQTFRKLIPILESALRAARKLSQDGTTLDLTVEAGIALQLGRFLLQNDEVERARQIYSEEIERLPFTHEFYWMFLTSRALTYWPPDTRAALDGFQKAIRAGATSVWPYYFVALHLMREQRYAEAVRLCNMAMENAATPSAARAELHRLLAIAYANLGQASDWVRQNFELAERLDPHNELIREDRQWYESNKSGVKTSPRTLDWPSRSDILNRAWDSISNRVERQQEQLGEQYSKKRHAELLAQ